MRKYLTGLLLSIGILYLAAVGYLYIFQRSLQYYPDKSVKEISTYDLQDTKDFMTKSLDGANIQMWYRAPNPGMPMVVYLHGNAYTLGYRAPKFRELIKLGFGFIAPSYHGFGKSEGVPTQDAIMGDAITAVNYLESQGYKTKNSIVVGESLGTGVAVELATKFQFAGVFLITPYTSIANRAQEIYWFFPVKWLVKDNFSSEDKITHINAPLLIIHGTKDDVIPHSHAERLIELAHEPKKLIIYEGIGHSNYDDVEAFKEMKRYFLDEQKN